VVRTSNGERRLRVKKVTKIWKCKDGTRVRICDMADSHLANAMKMLEQMARQREHQFVMADNPFQGEIAAEMFDGEQSAVLEEGMDVSDVYPIYDDLFAEAQRRKLAV